MRHPIRISHATPWHGPWRIKPPIQKKKIGTNCCRPRAYQVHKYVPVPGTASNEHSIYLVLLYWVYVFRIPVRTGDTISCWEKCRCCSHCVYTYACWWYICSNKHTDYQGAWYIVSCGSTNEHRQALLNKYVLVCCCCGDSLVPGEFVLKQLPPAKEWSYVWASASCSKKPQTAKECRELQRSGCEPRAVRSASAG